MAKHTPRAEKSSKQPIWPPLDLFSTLSHCLCVCLTVSVLLSISHSLPDSLFLSHTLLPSLYHSLTVSLTHYFCLLHLSHSSSLCVSFTISSPSTFTMSLPLNPLLFLSLPISSIFPITVCLPNTLVSVEKSLSFHWTNMARRHNAWGLPSEKGAWAGERPLSVAWQGYFEWGVCACEGSAPCLLPSEWSLIIAYLQMAA